MSRHYILDDHNNVIPAGMMVWAKWFEKNQERRRVGETWTHNQRVSTVFLGLDHSFASPGDQIVFETMIFAPDEIYMRRCRTWMEAVMQHAQAVRWATPTVHPTWKGLCYHMPTYHGAQQHMFVLIHVRDDLYVGHISEWVGTLTEARTFTHEEALAHRNDSSIDEDARWFAIGRRFNLED